MIKRTVLVGTVVGLMVATGANAAAPSKRPAKPGPSRAASISPTGILSVLDLIAIAAQVEKYSNQRDAFSVDPSVKYAGREFLFTQSLREDNGTEYGTTNSRWSYDTAGQDLTLTLKQRSNYEFYWNSKNLGSFTARNAFGVKWKAKASAETSVNIETDNGYDVKLTKTLHLPPAQARVTALLAKLVVKGVLTGGGNCSNDEDKATISDPSDVYTHTCSLKGHITDVGFFDEAGNVIARWNEHPTPEPETKPIRETLAQPSASVPMDVTWITQPTSDQMIDAYPDRAQRLGKRGRATLSCYFTKSGSLTSCAVVSEDPADYGFGAGAQKLSRHFKADPIDKLGKPVEGRIIVLPINFSLP